MSEDAKNYSNEMRGSLFEETERKGEKSPIATGTITISGVELRIAMWPSRVAGANSKAANKKYWPVGVEYKQGTKWMLVKIKPEDVTATGAVSDANKKTEGAPSEPVGDLPF